MTRRLAAIATVAIAALVLPSSSPAQELATQPVTPVTTPAAAPADAGPSLDGATVGFQQRDEQAIGQRTVVLAQARRGGTNSTALMIVGGAAFVAGALIDGDAGTLIMVGGAAIGLYGLYLYLN